MIESPTSMIGKGLAQKILSVMADVPFIDKDSTNQAQRYKYVSEANAVEKIRAAMLNHGLIVLPDQEECSTINMGNTKDGASKVLVQVKIAFHLIDVSSMESVVLRCHGHGYDSLDKGLPKAITAANKYFLLKIFQVATNWDPEKETETQKKQRLNMKAGDPATAQSHEKVDANADITEEQAKKIEGLMEKKEPDTGKTDSEIANNLANWKALEGWMKLDNRKYLDARKYYNWLTKLPNKK